MKIMLVDESNVDEKEVNKFLIYGGLIFDVDKVPAICDKVESLRKAYGYPEAQYLKFNQSDGKPKSLSAEKFLQLKNKVTEVAIDGGAQLVAIVVHKGLLKNHKGPEKFTWTIDRLLQEFQEYLVVEKTHGICVFDHLPIQSPKKYLEEKFSGGLKFKGKRIRLDRICLLGESFVGASYLNSVLDVVVGSVRVCINQQVAEETNRAMFKNLLRLFRKDAKSGMINEHGVIILPTNLNTLLSISIKQDYMSLYQYFSQMKKKAVREM